MGHAVHNSTLARLIQTAWKDSSAGGMPVVKILTDNQKFVCCYIQHGKLKSRVTRSCLLLKKDCHTVQIMQQWRVGLVYNNNMGLYYGYKNLGAGIEFLPADERRQLIAL